ncbi:MAG: TonB-dependent receptor [Parasphingorhabdus sp.]|uniref:TonB-dependent receptor domain-containing protein n=1 Tax=Parasphingorhabdus sp. TaxID=2709688 RepID=UPI0030031452
MRKFTKLKASVAPMVLGLAMVSTPAFAQDAETADKEPGDMIVVTGSRIVGAAAISTAPVQVLSSEAIESSGVTNIQEELLKNPVFGTPTFSRTNTSFSVSGSGLSTVDLRNLGVDRTLVLVNGRRFVSGIPGSGAVDLNAIPTSFIERVEVLTSGSASAVYGSDAVAGVVNFIYKKDFQGVQLDGQVGITEEGDSFEYSTGVTLGGNFADDRGNVVAYFGYTNEGKAFKSGHKTESGRSGTDSISLGLLNGNDADLFTRAGPFYSSYSPQGRYFTDNSEFTYANNGTGALRPCFSTNGGTAPASCGAFAGQQIGPDGFNRDAFRYLAIPTERFLFATRANYEVSDSINLFMEGTFSSTRATSNIEPFAFATDDAYDDGQMPIETLVGGVATRNPFVPDAIYNDSSDTNGDGLRDIFVTKRLLDFGPRASTAKRETFRIVVGAEGEFTEGWNYEVFANYGQTDSAQNGTGQINVQNFRNSMQVEPDGSGGFQCADVNARNEGCVPSNFFGLGSLSPESVAYLQAPASFNSTIKQTQIGANVGGELFSLTANANPIAVTVGGEYRRESSVEIPDALTQLGLNAGNAIPQTSGQFDVYEFYGEVLVPLIADTPFFHDLSVRGAARYSKYSTIGSTYSYNFGGEWAPVEDIRFRAMYAQTVRAPNIGELFSGVSQTFPTVQDPCEGIMATGGGALGDNCRAAVGVNANIAANGGVFTVNQSDRQGVTGFDGGNLFLQEEKGKTFTAGVVINPRSIDALRNLTLSVDYFDVKIDDAIVSTPRQFILDQCYGGSVQSFCDAFIVRRPAVSGPNSAGSLDEVNSGSSNSGGYRTRGIDVVFNYVQDFNLFSAPVSASLNVAYTHLISGYLVPLPGAEKDPFAGEVGASKDRFTSRLVFATDDVRWSFTGTYIGEAYLDNAFTGVLAGENPDYRLHPEFYLDTQIRFMVADQAEFFVGVDNVLNNSPIYTASIPGASVTGMDADTGTYDALGRRFYSGVKLKF